MKWDTLKHDKLGLDRKVGMGIIYLQSDLTCTLHVGQRSNYQQIPITYLSNER